MHINVSLCQIREMIVIEMPGMSDGNRFHRGEMGQVRGKEIGSYRGKVPSERSILGMPFPRRRYQRQG